MFPLSLAKATGTVLVIDTNTGESKRVPREDYNSCANYVSPTVGRMVVLDTITGEKIWVTKEEYKKTDHYVRPHSKKIAIYKSDGSVFSIFYGGDFVKFCKQNNLSSITLRVSYQNGGTPILMNLPHHVLCRLKKQNRDFQIGWYAKEIK